jgi:hypothetical protein
MTLEIFRLFGRYKTRRAQPPVARAMEECAYGICMKADIGKFMWSLNRLDKNEVNAYVDWAQPKLIGRVKAARQRYATTTNS